MVVGGRLPVLHRLDLATGLVPISATELPGGVGASCVHCAGRAVVVGGLDGSLTLLDPQLRRYM